MGLAFPLVVPGEFWSTDWTAVKPDGCFMDLREHTVLSHVREPGASLWTEVWSTVTLAAFGSMRLVMLPERTAVLHPGTAYVLDVHAIDRVGRVFHLGSLPLDVSALPLM